MRVYTKLIVNFLTSSRMHLRSLRNADFTLSRHSTTTPANLKITELYLYSKTFRIRQTANDFNPELLAEVQKYGEIETGIIVGGSAYITMKKRAEAPISMQKLRQLNIDGNVTN
uniref:uncharacterized protein LOC120328091 isoform X2 n=1 Tax=Styela clava TaxID=7725 RepID=UPI001939FEB4|nr:uncharacterized protein LOC120328091 isoform X2 [Styela clava]